jgi:transposase-like protein
MMHKGGRPTKLNDEIKTLLLEGIRGGLALKAACRYAGISYSTFANWRQQYNRRADSEASKPLVELCAAVEAEIRHQREQHRLDALARFKNRDWRYGWSNPMPQSAKDKLRERALASTYP